MKMSIKKIGNLNKPSFIVKSLGCKVNHYDSAFLKKELFKRGFVEFSEKREEKRTNIFPDLVIINTCTVTKKAITKDQQVIRELAKKFKTSKIVVMGCWPQTDKNISDNKIIFDDRELFFWGVGNLSELANNLSDRFKVDSNNFLETGLLVSTDRARYFLKVGDGCNQFCSYCIIPFARGRLKSRPSRELVAEAREVIKASYNEIILSGIHLGRYGEDLKENISLVKLLKKFLKIENFTRLRLSSIEINEVNSELINLIAKEKRICRHLHISLQSGSDKILKAMNRPYTSKLFLKRVAELRKKIPDIAITTDIIVGFPGETLSDFKKTYDFVKLINFSKVHVFPFSCHEQTRASKMKNKVNSKEIQVRASKLRKLSTILEKDYYQKILSDYQNKTLTIVIEGYGFDSGKWKSNKIRGKSQYSFDLEFSEENIKEKIKLKDLRPGMTVNVFKKEL